MLSVGNVFSVFLAGAGYGGRREKVFAASNNIGVKADTMPRHYISKHKNVTYPESNKSNAVRDIRSGKLSLRAASAKWGVPKSTLHEAIKPKHPIPGKYGGQTVFSPEEEAAIVKSLNVTADWGFPLRAKDLRNVVQSYLNRKGLVVKCFKDNMPGRDWLLSFLKRNPVLTLKLCENIKKVRAEVSQESVKSYFDELNKTLEGVTPDCVLNFDETNFSDDPGTSKVITKRGKRHADRVIDSSKQSTSVMLAITATGKMLPPYTVYKAKYLYDPWMEGGVEGARYNCSLSGWFDMQIFDDWFESVVVPFARRKQGPVVIIGDGLSSHLSIEVVRKCQELNIRFALLPANSTHLLQPLDVSFFHPLKMAWRKCLLDWKLKNRGCLPKTEFPRMLGKALESIGQERIVKNSQSGFKACGIVPFDPQVVLKKLPSEESSNETVGEVWAEALIDHLKQLRGGGDKGKAAPTARRGKRRNITAGRSLAVDDVIGTVMDEGENDPSEVSVNESNSNCSDVDDPGETSKSSQSNPTVESEDETVNPVPNDFVLIKLPYDGKDKDCFFVGKILSVVDEDNDEGCAFKIQFMRKKDSEKMIYFVFPSVNDVDTVAFENVIKILKAEEMRRGRIVFKNVDLSCVQ